MHESVRRWAAEVLDPSWVAGKEVLEVGAFDVNGSLRPLIEEMGAASYLGTDMRPGPGVDRVLSAEELVVLPAQSVDLLICTEMLEHARLWASALHSMKRLLRPGGRLLLTTRSPGAARHAYPDDYWRFTQDDMRTAFAEFRILDLRDDPDSPGVFCYAERGLSSQAPTYITWAVAEAPR